ncbi:MAG: LamG-like jellyroll fold domain-containing protein [Acidimicrobiales bacterium]
MFRFPPPPPPTTGGLPVRDYLVEHRAAGTTPWVRFVDAVSPATSATVTGLTDGTAYELRVRAANDIGAGAPRAGTAAVAPGAPGQHGAPVPSRVVVSTLAGSGVRGPAIDGPAGTARFARPEGLAVDALGTVYVADRWNHSIRRITPAGVVSTLAGSGSPGGADGVGTAASFSEPIGLGLDAAGNLLVAEWAGNRVRRVSPSGVVTTLAGSGVAGTADGVGTAASFNGPYGLAVDADGTVFVSDWFSHRIRRISPSGVVTTLAGSGAGFVNGSGSGAAFTHPQGLGLDAAGNVYVGDAGNGALRRVTPAGVVSTVATGLSWPGGVAVAVDGTVFVDEHLGYRVRRVSPAGVVTTVAGTGVAGTVDGPGSMARFADGGPIAVDRAGVLYTTNLVNPVIRRIAPVPAGSVALAWSPPSANAVGITDYLVEYRPVGQVGAWTQADDGVSPAPWAVVGGLADGSAYDVRVSAVNGAGPGMRSPVATVTPTSTPGAPGGLRVMPGNGQLALTWSAPGLTGGSPVTDYVVEVRATGTSAWRVVADGVSTATVAPVPGIVNGITYEVRVSAVNVEGVGRPSPAVSSAGDGTLAARWPLDATAGTVAADVSGNGRDGTVAGGAAWAPARVGNGLVFDGVDDRVLLPDTGVAGSFTLSLWMRPSAFGTDVRVVSSAGEAPCYSGTAAFSVQLTGTTGLAVAWPGCNWYPTWPVSLQAGRWYHLAVVVQAGISVTAYLDGRSVGTATSGVPAPGTRLGRLGLGSPYNPSDGTSYGTFFTGSLDEVQLFARALGAAEVAVLAGGVDAGLLAHWRLDEGAGVVAADASGHQRNAFLGDGARWGDGPAGTAAVVLGSFGSVRSATPLVLSGSFSWSAWVQRTHGGRAQTVIGHGGATFGFGPDDRFRFGFGSSTLSTSAVTDTAWHLWTGTYDAASGARRLYRDGVLVAADVAPSGHNADATVRIGVDGAGTAAWLTGAVDDVRIHGRALSAIEAATLLGPVITGAEDDVAFDGETAFTITGAGFGTAQGAGRVELLDGVEYATARRVAQAVSAWSGGSVDVTVGAGSLPAGPVFVVVTTADGVRSAPYPIRLEVADGLVRWWRADEGAGPFAADASGAGGTAGRLTLANGATWAAGVSGAALALDGADDVARADDPGVGTTFTLAAWVRPDAVADDVRLLSNRDAGAACSGNQFSLRFNGGRLELWSSAWRTVAPGPFVAGRWYHVAVSSSDAGATVYVDGVATATVTDVHRLRSLGVGAPLACGATTFGAPLRGRVDDVRLYGRVLPAAEVARLGGPRVADAADERFHVGEAVVVSGSAFGAVAGRVELASGPDHTTATLVAQTVATWSDGAAEVIVNPGGLAAGSAWLFVVDAAGQRSAPYPVEVRPEDALVVHWPFEESSGLVATDVSGSGDTGTLTGMGGTAERVVGRFGSGLRLNATDADDVVLDGSLGSVLDGDVTVSVWFVRDGRAPIDGGGDRIVELATADGAGLQIVLDPSSGLRLHDSGGPSTAAGTATDFADGQWHHAVGVRSGSTYLLYVDGVLVGSTVGTVPTYRRLAVGNSARRTANEAFAGVVDDVRVYARALPASEVAALTTRPQVTALDGRSTGAVTFDGKATLTIAGGAFGASQGAGRVEVVTAADDARAVRTAQVVTAWAERSIDVTVALGGLPAGDYHLVVTTTLGQRSRPFPVRVLAADGLVGWWPLDDPTGAVARDRSGSGADAVVAHGAAAVGGRSGGALAFDGVDDFARIPLTAALRSATGPFTIALWTRVDDPTRAQILVNNHVQLSGSPPTGAIASVDSGRTWFQTRLNDACCQQMTGGAVTAGRWTHVVVQWDGTTLRQFVDGVAQPGPVAASGTIRFVRDLVLGANADDLWPTAAGRCGSEATCVRDNLRGALDDVRVYTRVLSADEITGLAGPQVRTAEDGVAFDGETAFALDGSGFGLDVGTVELVATADGSGPAVPSTVTAWGPSTVEVTVRLGTFTPGARWIVVTDRAGRRSAPFPVRVLAAEGLLGRWSLDEPGGPSVFDTSGWGHDGTVEGTVTRGVGAVSGTGYAFEAAPGLVRVARTPALGALGTANGDATVSFWVRPGPPTGHWRPVFNLHASGISDRVPGVWLYPGDNRIHFRWTTTASSNPGVDSVTALQPGVWSQVTLTKTGSTLRVYLNGALDAQGVVDGVTTASNAELLLCNGFWGEPGFHRSCGAVDDVRLYDRALTGLEIASLAGQWTPADLATPPALWLDAADPNTLTLSGNAVTQWRDKSGRGRHASQDAAAARPTFVGGVQNGRGAVVFDGLDDTMRLAAAPLSSQQNTAVVVDTKTATTNPTVGFPAREVLSNWTMSNSVTSYFLGVTDVTRVRFSDAFASAGTVPTGQPLVLSAEATATDAVTRLHGAVLASRGAPLTTRDLSGPWVIGSQGAYASWPLEYWQGPINEVVLVDAAMATIDRQRIEGYLAWKWGTVDRLPAGHPFLTAPPMRTVPGAPLGVQVTPGDGSVTVSWTAPAHTGGAPLSGYTATVSAAAQAFGQSCSTSGATSCTITGLSNGYPYVVRVTASTTAATGAASVPSVVVVPRTTPAAPGAPTVTRTGSTASVGVPRLEATMLADPTLITATREQWDTSRALIPMLDGVSYRLSADLRADAVSCCSFLGYANYDLTGSWIGLQYQGLGYTYTTLARDLRPGDTTFRLASTANWYAGPNSWTRNMVFLDYQDGFGTSYPGNGYSQWASVPFEGTWNEGGIDAATGTVTLRSPWGLVNPRRADGVWPAGTRVANSSHNSTYSYVALAGSSPTAWTTFTGIAAGRDAQVGDVNPMRYDVARPGSSYLTFLWGVNHIGGTTPTYLRNQTIVALDVSGGAKVSGYTVEAGPGGPSCTVVPPATSCTIEGLSEGVSYAFRARAANAAGAGPWGAATEAPGRPTAVSASATEAAVSTVAIPGAVSLGGSAFDAAGNLYVADAGAHVIRRVTPAGVASVFAGSGTPGFADGATASFCSPSDVAVDAAGNVLVADTCNHRIRRITPAGVVSTVAGSGATTQADGTGIAASFRNPAGVAVGPDGSIVVGEYGDDQPGGTGRVRRISPAGVVSTVAALNRARGVAVDPANDIYAAVGASDAIYRVTPAGAVSLVAGTGGMGFADGPALSARVNFPTDVALDAAGNLYVADLGNRRVRVLGSAGTLRTVAGTGATGSADGLGTTATLTGPLGVAVAPSGAVMVGDGAGLLRRIDPAGAGRVTVSWSPPSGGAAILGHTVEYSTSPSFATVSGRVEVARPPAVLTGLADGTPVYVRVQARSSVGAGTWSDPVAATPRGVPYGVSNEGLVGWWKLDESTGTTVTDASGAGNHATAVGAPALGVTAVRGTGSTFAAAAGTRVEVPVSADLAAASAGDVTIALWVRPNSQANSWRTLYQHDRSPGLWLHPSTNRVRVHASVDGVERFVDTAAALPADSWSHVAFVRSGSSYRLYVNGVLDGSNTFAGAINPAGSATITLGGSTFYAQSRASLDDVQVFRRALTDREIQRLGPAQAGPAIATPPGAIAPVVHCRFAADCAALAGSPPAGAYQFAFEAVAGASYRVVGLAVDGSSTSWDSGTELGGLTVSSPTAGVGVSAGVVTTSAAGRVVVTVAGAPVDTPVVFTVTRVDGGAAAAGARALVPLSRPSATDVLAVFTTPGTARFTVPTPGTVRYTVVGGGGGGGAGANAVGGGGAGAGGVRSGTLAVGAGATSVVVGAGGAGGVSTTRSADGQASSFGTLSAAGGGRGGRGGHLGLGCPAADTDGGAGGSGGAGAFCGNGVTGTSGTGNTPAVSPAQGFGGGAPNLSDSSSGGGGAGSAGRVGGFGTGGNGGTGAASAITGVTVNYGGGGGGGGRGSGAPTPAGTGGTGGGGAGSVAGTGMSGVAGSGGGGGGGSGGAGGSGFSEGPGGGAGGSGIVVVRRSAPAVVSTFLSDLQPNAPAWGSFGSGYPYLNRDRAENGAALKKAGVVYAKGVLTHPGSGCTYKVANDGICTQSWAIDGATSFKARIAIDEGTYDTLYGNGVVFSVYLDGNLAYQSGTMLQASAPIDLDLDTTGRTTLTLGVHPVAGEISYDHSVWYNARLERTVTAGTDPGLVGHWTFDDGAGTTVVDASGNGNNGTLVNADPSTAWAPGRVGGALALDGVNDFVNLGNSSRFNFNNKSFTIALWGSGAVANGTFVVAKGRGAWQGWDLSGAQATVGDADSGVQGFLQGPSGSGAPFFSAGVWSHAAVTVDVANLRMTLYRNGIKDREVPITTAVSSQYGTVNLADVNMAANDLLVGTRADGATGPWFGGRVDDLRLYDRALSGAEVAELAQVPSAYGVSGPSMWIDASDLDGNSTTVGEPAVGTSVLQANDRSGAGTHFVSDPTVATDRPVSTRVWGFRYPVLRFSTTQWMRALNRFDLAGSMTVVYLAAPRSSSSSMTRALQGVGNNWLLGWSDNASDRAFFEGWVHQGWSAKPPTPTVYSAVIRGPGQPSSVFRDGSLLSSNTGGVTGPNGLSFNKGLYSTTSGNANAEIDVAEVLVFPRALSDAERATVETALRDKWLTSRNPSPAVSAYGVAEPGLWVDASDLDGDGSAANEPGVGSSVGRMADKSGFGREFVSGTAAQQPVRTSVASFRLPVLRFATTQWMQHAGTRFDSPSTVVYVARPQSTTGTGRILQARANNWLLGWWNGRSDSAFYDGWVNQGSTSVAATPQVYTAVVPGSGQASSVYRNGVLVAANTGGVTGPDGLTVNNGPYGEVTATDLAEIVVFPRALSDAERTAVEQALLAKWIPQVPVRDGLVLSVDANDRGSMTTDAGGSSRVTQAGQSVCRWADRSGLASHFTQTTTAQCPTYGVDAAGGFVQFTANGWLGTSVPLAPDASVFAIVESNTTSFNTHGWIVSARGPNGLLIHPLEASTANQTYVVNRDGSWAHLGNDVVVPTARNLYELTVAGTADSTGVVGVNGAVRPFAVGGHARTAGMVPLDIGRDQCCGVRHGDGRYREVLVFDRALSPGERQQVEGYLAWKWGVAGSLPADHPHRLVAPSNTPITASVPAAPSQVTLAPSSGQLAVSWSPSATDGGAIVTDYVVQYSTSSTFSTFASTTVAATQATITGLANGSLQYVRVRARNAAGTSPWSPVVSAPALQATTCRNALTVWPQAPSGTYTLYPAGAAISAYCDMMTDGGGWTLVSFVDDRDSGLNRWAVLHDCAAPAVSCASTDFSSTFRTAANEILIPAASEVAFSTTADTAARVNAGRPLGQWSWSWRCGRPAGLDAAWIRTSGPRGATSLALSCTVLTQTGTTFPASFTQRLWYGRKDDQINSFMVAEETGFAAHHTYFYPDWSSCQDTPMLHTFESDATTSPSVDPTGEYRGMTRAVARSSSAAASPAHSCRFASVAAYQYQDGSRAPVEAAVWVR